ncbi:acyltransferase domain-containing protein, partial [Streptomyces sp. A012304]|uniref:acyltransferase domain-containing protein n=1 Tax=Streptomyces sp. A012304 TaxID=375446 RepID=UPI00222FF30B
GMASLGVPVERASELIAEYGGRVSVAAVNGPASVTVAGEPAALEELLAVCEAQGVWARRVPVDYASHSVQVEAIRERLLAELAGIEPQAPMVPFFSAVTAERLENPRLDAEYWYTNLRQTVRFEETVRVLLAQGFDAFVEASAHPVLTTPIEGTVESADADAVVLGTLRRGEGGQERFTAALAEAFVNGLDVDWTPLVGEGDAHVDLPTYAFQHQRYWLERTASSGDARQLGLTEADHPLLGAAVALGDGQGVVLTGRLSLSSHPWLRDHTVAGTVLLPGAAFVELAVRAGDEVGHGRIDELALEAPLVIPEQGSVRIQVVVGAAEPDGTRALGVFSQDADESAAPAWTRHAAGTLSEHGAAPEAALAAEAWPPPGAQPVDLDGFYSDLVPAGYAYGPAFQGLRTAWRAGDDLYAEVALPEDVAQGAADFGLHPALLDAALHAALPRTGAAEQVRLPFVFKGLTLHAAAATQLRVRLSPTGTDAVRVTLYDAAGGPVASVEALTLRPIAAEALTPALPAASDDLFRVDWIPAGPAEPAFTGSLWALDADTPDLDAAAAGGVPDAVVLPCLAGPVTGHDHAASVHRTAAGVLSVVREWLGDERFAGSRLVVVTRGAVGAG